MDDQVFLVEVDGFFGPDQLEVVWRDEPRPPHPELDRMVWETWSQRLGQAQRDGVMLFNGQLVRYLRHRVQADRLTIEAGPTDFANFLATNYLNPDMAAQFGWDLFSNPLGTSAIVVSADGWLSFGRRNQRVACYPGYVHAFGGGLEAQERQADGTIDAFASTRRELREELAVTEQDVREMLCLGLLLERRMRQPELVFETGLSLDRQTLAERLRPDHPEEEHADLMFCRDAPDAIVPFILAQERISPMTVGALCRHGRLRFGQDWYAEALAELARRPPSC